MATSVILFGQFCKVRWGRLLLPIKTPWVTVLYVKHRWKQLPLSAIVVFLRLAVVGASEGPTNEVTATSITKELHYKHIEQSNILALLSFTDERALFMDNALVVVRFPKGRWRLVHACRNPKDKDAFLRQWRPRIISDAEIVSERDFDHRPTQAEVQNFIDKSFFTFSPPYKFIKLIRGEIYSKTWMDTLGYKPSYVISKE
jgi:hypothetical protein